MYSSEDQKTIEILVERLGGIETVRRLLSDELVVTVTIKWKTWRKIKLGTGPKNANEFRQALSNISDWANDIIGRPGFIVSPIETEYIELVNVSAAELGFKDGATRADIYRRAQELGLDICPNEVGPQLRLQYRDQPNNERLLVAMEPVADAGGHPSIFNVRCDSDKKVLDADYGQPDYSWPARRRWIFQRRK